MFDKLKNNISNNQRKYGALLSYVQMGLGIVIALLYTPYMIRMLGKNEYGLYSTVASTIQMLSFLNLGLNAGYIRYFARYNTENNNEAIDSLNGLYLLIFLIIGFIALVCGLVLSFNLDFIFSKGLTQEEYEIAKVLALLVTFNLSFSFPASVFSTIISAHEKFVVLKLLAMIRSVATPAIMIPVLYYGYKSIAMVTVTLILSLVVDIAYYVYCRKNLKIKFCFNNFEKGILRSLFAYTFFIALNGIFDQITWSIDKCILARYRGTVAVAIYSVAYSLYMFYQSMSCSISGVFTPRIHAIVNEKVINIENRNKNLTELFVRIGRIQFFVVALITSGFYFFGKQFLLFWVGNGYDDSYYITFMFMASASIALIQNTGIEIQRALNKHQFRSLLLLTTSIMNLIISIYLCQLYGAIGCAIGTVIVLLFGPGLVMNIFYHKKCGLNIILFWKNILRVSLGVLPPVALMLLANNYIQFNTLPNFIGGIVFYTIFYCVSIWFCSLNSYEKGLIFRKNNEK